MLPDGGVLRMSVSINGTVCRNCFDVDWAKQAAAEDKKKHELEAAKQAKEATAPVRSPGDPSSQSNQASGYDGQPAIVLGGSLAGSDAGPPPPVTLSDLASVKVDVLA